jgi:(p)ppGpp synthase/HD superfamily hydrolase
MTAPEDLPFRAASFAAQRHKHQFRKDKETPYVSHVFRVCLVVRHVFGFNDTRMLATALLHDTIEDTNTDYDDIADEFGHDVARWVAALTKETRLPDDEREVKYMAGLADAEWQVKACKLADIYDNLGDSASLSTESRKKTVVRSRRYLDSLSNPLPEEIREAFRLTEARLAQVAASV